MQLNQLIDGIDTIFKSLVKFKYKNFIYLQIITTFNKKKMLPKQSQFREINGHL